jgi:lipoate-protein ligase A
VDPKQPKNVKFSLWSIIETSPRGGAYDVSGEGQKFSGDAQNDLMGGATSPHLPLKIRLWKADLQLMHRIMPMWKYGKHRTDSDIDT